MWSYDDTLGDYVQQLDPQVTEWERGNSDFTAADRESTALPKSRQKHAGFVSAAADPAFTTPPAHVFRATGPCFLHELVRRVRPS